MRHSFTLLLLGATLAFAGHSVNGDVPELTKVKDEWRSDLQKRFRRTQSVNGVQPATVETEAKLYRSAKVENVKKKMTVMSSTDVRMKGLNSEVAELQIMKKESLAHWKVLNAKLHGTPTDSFLTLEQLRKRMQDLNTKTTNQEAKISGMRNGLNKLAVKELRNYHLKLTAVGVLSLALIAAAFYGMGGVDWVLHNRAGSDYVPPVISAEAVMKEQCADMFASAARVEGMAWETMSLHQWNSSMESLIPMYGSAYREAFDTGLQDLKQRVLENQAAVAPPAPVYVPVHTSPEVQGNMKNTQEQVEVDWLMTDLARPLQSQLDFAQNYSETIHQAAFELMLKSNDPSFNANSTHFDKVYTGCFARLAISTRCFKYSVEDRATTAQFAALRAHQAGLESQMQDAVDSHLASTYESATPPIASAT